MTKRKRARAPDVIDVEAEPVDPSFADRLKCSKCGTAHLDDCPKPIVVEVKASPPPPSPMATSSPPSRLVIRGIDVHATIDAGRRAVEVGEKLGELVAGVLGLFSDAPAPKRRRARARSRSRGRG